MRHTLPYRIVGFFIILFVLQGCATDEPGNWQNEHITSGKRKDFHELNDQALNYLKNYDYKNLQLMLAKEVIEDHYTERQVNLIGNRLKTTDYVLLDEYYTINKYKDFDTISSASKGTNRYQLIYPGNAQEMYIVFFLPKKAIDKWMITLVYSKLSYGWKITELDLAPYTRNGSTAPELFALARERYSKGYLIDAVNDMRLAGECLRPADIWKYPVENAANAFLAETMNEANHKFKFPYVLFQVPTHPMVFRIVNDTRDGHSYPMVYYLSRVKLADMDDLKKENDAVTKVIGKLIPGIDKDKKYVLYTVFNQMPNSQRSVERVVLDDKLN